MADKDFNVEIKTTADTSGVKATTAALKDTTAAAKQAGDATKAHAADAEKAAETMKPFAHEMREVRKVTRELGHEFPLAALALKAFLNPIGAAVGLAVGFFVKMKESIDEVNKSLDEAAAKAAEPTFKEAIDHKREALEKAEVAADAFRDKIAHAGEEVDKEARILALATEAAKQFAEIQDKIADFKKTTDEHYLERAFHNGIISAQEYYARLAALEKKAIEEKAAREKAALDDQEKTLEDSIARRQGKQNELQSDADRQFNDTAETAANVGKHRDDFTESVKRLPEAEATEKSARSKIESRFKSVDEARRYQELVDKGGLHRTPGEQSELTGLIGAHPLALAGAPSVAKDLSALDKATSAADQARLAASEENRKQVVSEELAVEQKKRDTARAQELANLNKEQIGKETQDLDTLKRNKPAQLKSIEEQKAEDRYKQLTDITTPLGREGAFAEQGAHLEQLAFQASRGQLKDARGQRRNLTGDESKALQAYRDAEGASGPLHDAILRFGAAVTSANSTTAAKVIGLERLIKQQNEVLKNAGIFTGSPP